MSDDIDPRFPVTLWPATPLPPIYVQQQSPLAVRKDGTLAWGAKASRLALPQPLPDEWVLRQLGDADLDDDEVIVGLLEEYGAIMFPYSIRNRAWIPEDRHPLMASPDSKFAKLEDARWYLKTARALAHMWADASADGDALGLWKQEGFAVLGDDDDDRGFRWLNFTTALNAGLEPFQAHVNYKGITEPFADLYNGACHQIFNLMVGGHTARHCEKCGRVFVHQLGGAKYRQHRVDARYCTPACARAEASRQYRRRKAAQRKDRR